MRAGLMLILGIAESGKASAEQCPCRAWAQVLM